jgi:hypothetical protein
MNRSGPFLYRVEITDKNGKSSRHTAEVTATLDETARRKIIHHILSEGGSVQIICPTEDSTRLPGDRKKRTY